MKFERVDYQVVSRFVFARYDPLRAFARNEFAAKTQGIRSRKETLNQDTSERTL
jgi:hypothetical protein